MGGGIPYKKLHLKFSNIIRKVTVSESLFNNVYWKKSSTGVFLVILQNFQKRLFRRTSLNGSLNVFLQEQIT